MDSGPSELGCVPSAANQCAPEPIQCPARRDASPLKPDQHGLAVKQVALTGEVSPPALRQDGSVVNQGGLAGDAGA